ncbi:MAG: 3-hydroxyacyl-ACP dehydratase FabZ [Candidatus Nitronauta litoralis]|uniref:3-hydroxyacyl-[acyl-carrier-protein] dehydratase FabZ n=1 Tax=Candidatus Nitronauta litoralis TaxID=2705533 RepID=A0A7T0BUE8_9BACT|nr:MAG: 3-hydroxyacyl-ACP dehydratase FabZ [Candidatus Nitronauta litoralis]
MLDIEDIKKHLPHRPPFLLVDRVIECDDESRIVGIKNVTINEPFFVGHFPQFHVMPGVLIVEALAQVGCILGRRILKPDGDPIVLFMGIDEVKFRKPVVPGDTLRLEMVKIKQRKELFRFQGQAFVDDNLVTQGIFQAMMKDPDSI